MPLQQDFFDTSWSMEHKDWAPVKLGFIGAGEMAEFAVLPALYITEFDLKAICDLDEKRAKLMADKFCGGNYYTDYQEMFEKEDLEAVIIQLQPGEARQRIAIQAMERGLDVFMPKPPTRTYAEAQQLAEVAQRTGRRLMVNFESRFSYAVRMAKKIMSRPEFGKLTQGSFSFCTGTYKDRISYRHGSPYKDTVHAYLLDFTPHHLDLARYLCGEVKQMALFHNEWEGESTNAVALQFASGAVGTLQLNSNRIWWRNYDHIELTGQGEYAVLESLWNIKHYTLGQNTFTENYRDERSVELTGDGFAIREFVASIRENRQPIANIADCAKTMELYQAIYDAVCEGRDGIILQK